MGYYVEGVKREQLVMFPQSLDEYIGEDNPVRFIGAFVDSLDLKALGFERAVPAEKGRPPYDPRDMMKLYIYGYVNRVRSSRRLEKESQRNVEVMWLVGKLTPDHKTIADFRRDNREGIGGVCREFTLYCREMEMFGGQMVAIDGSKFKAVNSRRRNYTAGKLKGLIKRVDEKVEGYLQELDENDECEPDSYRPTAEELKEKIAVMKARREGYEALQAELEESEETQISLTDADARSMVMGGGRGTVVGYNVQVSVDDKHYLIVDHEVVNEVTDRGQLSEMALRAKAVLGVKKLEALADMGYYDGQEVKACLKGGVRPYIPKPDTSSSKRKGLYGKGDFHYDSEQDCYRCPAGEELTFRFQTTEKGREIRYYATRACQGCERRSRCTENKRGRRVTRWVDEGLLEEMERRVQAEPEKVKRRKSIVEHPFGTIKHSMNQGYFLMRGLPKVRCEMSLTVLAYNIKRVVNILGVQRMVGALA